MAIVRTEFDLEASNTDIKVFPRELLRQDTALEAGKHPTKIRKVFKGRGLNL